MRIIITLVMVVIAILLTITWISNTVSSARIDSWLSRAKSAGSPAQVAEFLTNYKQALSEANRIEGKYSSFWKYPGNYMPVYIRAIDGLIDRANALAIQNSTDESYQMGLINLEKDLGDIEAVAFGVWNASGGWIIILLTCLFWATFVFYLILAVE